MPEELGRYKFYALSFENTFTLGALPISFSIFTRLAYPSQPS